MRSESIQNWLKIQAVLGTPLHWVLPTPGCCLTTARACRTLNEPHRIP